MADNSVISGTTPTAIPAPSGDRGRLDGAGAQALTVGGENLQQPVLDDDGETEGDEQRRQQIASQRPVQQHLLKREPDDEQDRKCDKHRSEGI